MARYAPIPCARTRMITTVALVCCAGCVDARHRNVRIEMCARVRYPGGCTCVFALGGLRIWALQRDECSVAFVWCHDDVTSLGS